MPSQGPSNWPPGVSGNPNGRPPGRRNKNDATLREQLKARGDIDSADFLSSVVTDASNEKPLRVHAAGLLLPYQHAKVQSVPALVFVVEPVDLPHIRPTSIQQAIDNIAHLDSLFRAGTLDLVSHGTMVKAQESIIDGFKVIGEPDPNPVIRIEGGLPELPGTNIIMPLTNGHELLEGNQDVTRQLQSNGQGPSSGGDGLPSVGNES
jgi:hypothetical protein